MKRRILQTTIVIAFTILMLIYAKDYDEKQNISRINNQKIITYSKPIGLCEKKETIIIGEKYKPLNISYLQEFKIVHKTTSKQKYNLHIKKPISLENLKISNNYINKLNKTINIYNDTFSEKYQKYVEQLEQLEQLKKEKMEQERLLALKNGFIKTQGDVSISNLELLYKQYNKIPQNVRTFFENSGWTIYLTTNKLGPIYYPNQRISIQGITDFSPKLIYIENRQKACENAIVHEIGHAIDSMVGNSTTFGFISYSDDFRNIYLEESNNFVEINGNGKHARSSTMEYFAEAFNQAILYPENCKKNSPKTYEYIMNIINNI